MAHRRRHCCCSASPCVKRHISTGMAPSRCDGRRQRQEPMGVDGCEPSCFPESRGRHFQPVVDPQLPPLILNRSSISIAPHRISPAQSLDLSEFDSKKAYHGSGERHPHGPGPRCGNAGGSVARSHMHLTNLLRILPCAFYPSGTRLASQTALTHAAEGVDQFSSIPMLAPAPPTPMIPGTRCDTTVLL